ncbi:NUDIX hydrolase [Rhizobium terrae]|uniref:NUDIX hydrolase n=1 Tax=Rhizobium terrae TaxID=2171756 RepID=UPI000E3C4BDF|nr:NUDIX hydrolase [Rhizobium terrae]
MTVEPHQDLSGLPGERVVFHVPTVRMDILSGDHPFYVSERKAIDANWQEEIAANPALFDGRMVLQRRVSLTADGLVGEGHIIPFRAFLWWRKQKTRAGGLHIHAYPVLESSDGALIAIRMGAHTANAGLVYFACGSFEAQDVFDGVCDVEYNMQREVMEETGLDLGDAKTHSGYWVAHFHRAVTLFRLFRFDLTADDIITRIERHMKVAEDKEIAGAVAIRSADHSAQNYHVGMLPVLDWYFADAPKAR